MKRRQRVLKVSYRASKFVLPGGFSVRFHWNVMDAARNRQVAEAPAGSKTSSKTQEGIMGTREGRRVPS